MSCDRWHVTRDTWHVTHDTWHMTCDTWHMTPDMWPMTGGKRWTFFQNFSCLALTVWEWRYSENISIKDQLLHWLINQLFNDKGVCSTAPVTPGFSVIGVNSTSIGLSLGLAYPVFCRFFKLIKPIYCWVWSCFWASNIPFKNKFQHKRKIGLEYLVETCLNCLTNRKIPHTGDTNSLDRCG